MNQKSIEHIALYSLVLVGTLVVGVLARQFVLSKGVDDFSSIVAFFAAVIVLMAIYASLQTTFNQFLLPHIEAFLLRFSAFQTMKNYNDTVSAPEALTIEDSNQATPDVIEPASTTEETISEPSEYEVMRTNAITENNRAIQTKLEKVLNYTKQTMVAYMSEEDLNRLCAYIVEYSSGDTLQKISPVKVDSQLKSIDIMHFGWNIGKAFSKKRIHTATFIKNVFAHTLRDLEISTIERKMSHTESVCCIITNKCLYLYSNQRIEVGDLEIQNIFLMLKYKIMENEKNNNQLQIELKEEVAQGTYANLAIITHSSSEFIVDFVRVMPGLPKAGVQSRIVLTPEHAKRLMYALQENVAKYERNFGPIRMPEEMNGGNNGPDGKTFIPPISGFKGEA